MHTVRAASLGLYAASVWAAGPQGMSARGIAVHAWVNVGLVSDATGLPTARTHLIRRHPEWLMVPRELAMKAVGLPGQDNPGAGPARTPR